MGGPTGHLVRNTEVSSDVMANADEVAFITIQTPC